MGGRGSPRVQGAPVVNPYKDLPKPAFKPKKKGKVINGVGVHPAGAFSGSGRGSGRAAVVGSNASKSRSGADATSASRNMMLRSRDPQGGSGSASGHGSSVNSAVKSFDSKVLYHHVEASMKDWFAKSGPALFKSTFKRAWEEELVRFTNSFEKNINKQMTAKVKRAFQKEVQDAAAEQVASSTKTAVDKAASVSE